MRNRAGFSRKDVAAALVMTVLVVATVLQLLRIRSQLFAFVDAGTESTRTGAATRALMELRSAGGAGLAHASASSITLRVPYAVGVVCGGEPAGTVAMVPGAVGDLDAEARAGLGWRDAGGSLRIVETTVFPDASARSSCEAVGVRAPRDAVFARLSHGIEPSATGAPAVLFREVHYGFRPSVTAPGRLALWRTEPMRGESVEVIAPFAERAAFRFYVDGATTPTERVPAPLSRVRGIELELPRAGQRVADPLPATVFFHERAS